MTRETRSFNNRISIEALLEKTADATVKLGPEFQHYHRNLINLSSRFTEGRFHLAVLGQFKRGKSTLLNALTGEAILPVGVIPLTAVPTFIQYGNTPEIRVKYKDGRPADKFSGGSIDERSAYMARFVTEEGNPQNRNGVAEVEADLPASILSRGVVLIDTPGIGSTFRHNTLATLNFLQQCDAALFLISADPPITEVELEFLREVQKKVPRLFFVLNKIDYLDEQELEQALDFYKHVLSEQAGLNNESPVFCVSARNGLKARAMDDAEGWTASGMAELETFLMEFLAREKFNALADAVSLRAVDLIDATLMEAGIVVQALQLPRQVLEKKIALFEETLKQTENERRLIHDVLEGDKKRVLVFLEEQARELRREAEKFLTDIMQQSAGKNNYAKSRKIDIQNAWAEAIPVFFEQQQATLNEQVKQRLLECLASHEQRLDQLVETLHHTAADLFQVPYHPQRRQEALEIQRKPYWVLNTWNTDALPLLKSTEQRMDELVRRNVENIRWSMLQNLNISFARFASGVKERLAETVAATKGAMEAANARREAQGGSAAAEVDRLGDQIARLKRLKAELAAFGPKSTN